jgi:hypothetical protein
VRVIEATNVLVVHFKEERGRMPLSPEEVQTIRENTGFGRAFELKRGLDFVVDFGMGAMFTIARVRDELVQRYELDATKGWSVDERKYRRTSSRLSGPRYRRHPVKWPTGKYKLGMRILGRVA